MTISWYHPPNPERGRRWRRRRASAPACGGADSAATEAPRAWGRSEERRRPAPWSSATAEAPRSSRGRSHPGPALHRLFEPAPAASTGALPDGRRVARARRWLTARALRIERVLRPPRPSAVPRSGRRGPLQGAVAAGFGADLGPAEVDRAELRCPCRRPIYSRSRDEVSPRGRGRRRRNASCRGRDSGSTLRSETPRCRRWPPSCRPENASGVKPYTGARPALKDGTAPTPNRGCSGSSPTSSDRRPHPVLLESQHHVIGSPTRPRDKIRPIAPSQKPLWQPSVHRRSRRVCLDWAGSAHLSVTGL